MNDVRYLCRHCKRKWHSTHDERRFCELWHYPDIKLPDVLLWEYMDLYDRLVDKQIESGTIQKTEG